jgi:hypothetical protein
MEETIKQSRLQDIRREEIPNTIAKYKALVEGIFDQVANEYPPFKDIDIKNEEEVSIKSISAEEQLYNFMLMREKAIDHADRMLNKINLLELELKAPDLLLLENKQMDQPIETAPKQSHAKLNAKKA